MSPSARAKPSAVAAARNCPPVIRAATARVVGGRRLAMPIGDGVNRQAGGAGEGGGVDHRDIAGVGFAIGQKDQVARWPRRPARPAGF